MLNNKYLYHKLPEKNNKSFNNNNYIEFSASHNLEEEFALIEFMSMVLEKEFA